MAGSFIDNLQTQSQSWLTNFGPQVLDSGLKSLGLIKVAEPPKSNLTAAQVGQGQKGVYLASPQNSMPAWIIPLAAVVVVLIGFLAIRRRGK